MNESKLLSSFDFKVFPDTEAEIFLPIKCIQWSKIYGNILLQMPLTLPTNMSQGHSISCIYQAVLVPGAFLKPVQIPKVKFFQAEG